MSKRDDFIALVKGQAGKAIYVWGGDGEDVTAMANPTKWIKNAETSTKNANRAIKLYNKRVKAGIKPIIAVDCSGFIYWALKKLGLRSGDINSRGLYSLCTPIKKSELVAGDLVFMADDKDKDGYETSEIYHVGAYIGGGKVAESKGRDDGVVITNLEGRGWDMFGRLPYFEDEPAAAAKTESTSGSSKSVSVSLPVLEKGDKGEAVRAMQQLLIKKGYSCGSRADDGDFGAKTVTALKAYQKGKGLTADAICGKTTWSKLLGL